MTKPKNYPFVEINIARLAKEKGFNGRVISYYESYENLKEVQVNGVRWNDLPVRINVGIDYEDYDVYKSNFSNKNEIDSWYSAPTYQELIDWFREEKKIDISGMPYWEYHGSPDLVLNGYRFLIQSLDKFNFNKNSEFVIGNYYEALQEALKKAFELI